MEELNSFLGTKYQNSLNIEKLQELNPYFKQFTSINKVIKFFKKIFKTNEIKIQQNKLNINLYFINPVDEEEKIYIELKEIKEDQKTIINNLCQIIKEIKEENIQLKKEIKELKENIIQSLVNENNKINISLKELKKEINNINNNINFISNLNEESKIINNQDDVDLINSWISFNKNIKYKRIYRATEDGDKASDFHRLCDNKNPTLVIGKTVGNYIFGGFTKAKWELNRGYIYDPDAFVFSLNQRKYFRTKDENTSIVGQKEVGPKFGGGNKGHAIEIYDNSLTNKSHWSNPNSSYGNNLNLLKINTSLLMNLKFFLF